MDIYTVPKTKIDVEICKLILNNFVITVIDI